MTKYRIMWSVQTATRCQGFCADDHIDNYYAIIDSSELAQLTTLETKIQIKRDALTDQ